MPKPRLIFYWCLLLASPAAAQFGGGAGGAGAGAPAAVEKPRFRDHVMEQGGLSLRREAGDTVVRAVRIVGNRQIGTERIQQLLRTRVDRVFDQQTVLADVRRLYEFRAFQTVRDSVVPDGQGGVTVTFTVQEYPLISQVIFHGNRAMGDRELRGRAGLVKDDPVSDSAIESTRRRLLDYYHEEGFSLATIESVVGLPDDPNAVVYRINEGPKERIASINIIGNSVVSEARLKKVIASRGPMLALGYYLGNAADMDKINNDVAVLTAYYRDLGYLAAKVDRLIEYDRSGKWLTVTFVIEEGPQFTVNEIRIVGNRFIDESSLRAGLMLKAGEPFNGPRMNTDVTDITYSYGSLGFIYAEVDAKLVWIDSENSVDVVYQIEEGDRWKVGHIYVEIDGEPNLMREYTMLNYLDLVEGQFIDRRTLEMNRRRLLRSELLETNPAVADPPDLRVVPQAEEDFGGAR